MKRFVLSVVTLLTISFSLQAQDYRPIEWDILRLGYVSPSAEGIGSGISFSTEPRFNINNNISTSIKMEFAYFGLDHIFSCGDLGAVVSYVLIGDYYFLNESNKRAFAGFGIGTYSGTAISAYREGACAKGGAIDRSSGVVSRLGFKLGIIRVTGEYNILLAEKANNYLGIHLGFTIGGRR